MRGASVISFPSSFPGDPLRWVVCSALFASGVCEFAFPAYDDFLAAMQMEALGLF